MTDGIGRAARFDLVLALSGGNALGAFEAGAYQALHETDLLPDWIVGTSIGAINGALIVGSASATGSIRCALLATGRHKSG